ncbi:MAG: DUF469 family protein [Tissierellia bacterium]|nr:DUF469 family protein [Tissierellia bacterium]
MKDIHVAEDLSYDDFCDKFIDFIEANNWSFGGGINGDHLFENFTD